MGNIDLDKHWPLPRSTSSPGPASPLPAGDLTDTSNWRAEQPHALPSRARQISLQNWDELFERPPRSEARAATLDDESVAAAPDLSLREDARRAPEPRPPSNTRSLAPFVWGGAGFIAGILAWHLVGFWTFVSDVVLNDHPAPLQASSDRPLSSPASGKAGATLALSRAPATEPADTKHCVTLAIDRSAGATTPVPCEGSSAALRDAGFRHRTDRAAAKPRLQDPVAWSGATAVNPDLETGTLQASDFNLNVEKAGVPD